MSITYFMFEVKTVGGRKQFDETVALDAAMKLFWQRGYEATSLAELELATGLNKSSIYNTFQSKEALFGRCLEQFSQCFAYVALEELSHPDFKTAVSQFFEKLLAVYDDPDLPKGCLVTMATIELGGSDSELADVIAEGMEATRLQLKHRCQQAVEDGQLAKDTDCEAVAAMILSMTRGIAVLNRGYGDLKVARQALRGMLASIAPDQS